MFRLQDLNPILKTPSGLLSSNNNYPNNVSHNNNINSNINVNNYLSNPPTSIPINNFSQSNTSNPLTPLFQNNPSLAHQNSATYKSQNHLSNGKSLTYTNFYKFCCLKSVNCYFYQFNNNNNNNNNTNNSNSAQNANANSIGSTYEVLQYEQLIKHKLKNDYEIADIITWIAKKELCVFQLQIADPNETFDSNIGFNQLKDAMSNIISENNLSLKLISASTFDANTLFKHNSQNNNSSQNQLQKKSLNVIYLSFLRAVHRFILQKMTNSHSLFEASNQSLSIDIYPYSGQLICSSMIQRSIVITTQNNTEFSTTSKKRKILKKLVPYSILKINPSLNQKNELIVNMASLKKIFYKLTDYISISCNNSIQILNEKSNFALYIAPSGIRCLIAGNSYIDSITEEPPENYEKLINILKSFNDIDIISNPTLINEKRLWIKIHPCGFNSSLSSPLISDYLDNSLTTGKKFIYWPAELCFIQFPSDSSPGSLSNDESSNLDKFSIHDPFQIIDEFVDIIDDINKTKLKEAEVLNEDSLKVINNEKKIPEETSDNYNLKPQNDVILENQRSEFKFPESFEFNTEIESIDQQLKPLKELAVPSTDSLNQDNEFDNLFDDKDDITLPNIAKQRNDNVLQQQLNIVFDDQPKSTDGNNEKNNTDEINLFSSGKKVETNFEDDWSDLFGDSEDGDDNGNDDSKKNNIQNNSQSILQAEGAYHYDKDMDDAIDSALENLENDLEIKREDSNINIDDKLSTKNEEIKPVKEDVLNKDNELTVSTSPFYQDPGAPSPIPFQIFAPAMSSDEYSSPATSNDDKINSRPVSHLAPKESKKSIFSPLNFNPLIEKDIDSKYSTGGKFFVKNVNQNELGIDNAEQNKMVTPSLNGTPASATETKFNQRMSFTTPSFFARGQGKSLENEYELAKDLLSDSEDDDNDDNEDEYNQDLVQSGTFKNNDFIQRNMNRGDDLANSEINDENIQTNILSDLVGSTKASDGDLGFELKDVDVNTETDEYIKDTGDETSRNRENSHVYYASDTSGLGIILPSTSEGNSAKRRKLETIFDNINDDDEFDLDFEEDEYDDVDEINSNEITNNKASNNATENKLENNETGLVNYIGASLGNLADQNISTLNNIEIPNSWFYVLRLVAPLQIPFNYLSSSKLKIEKNRIVSLLPILQEYVLYSQKYINNQTLNLLIQNRECPSVLDNDVEYLFYKIFPGINKMNCFELLDSESESKESKPFDSLFGLKVPDPANAMSNKSENELKLYDDNNYDLFSPTLNIPQTEINQNQAYSEDFNEEFQKLDLSEAIPSDNLFRVGETVLNLRRFNEDIIVNKLGLNYWKMLSLEPLLRKNFKILFVIPKADENFRKEAMKFLKSIIECYFSCKLGTIERISQHGIIEVESKCGTRDEYWESVQNELLSSVEELQNSFSLDEASNLLLMFVDPFQDLDSLIKMANVTHAFESVLIEKNVGEEKESLKKKKKRKNRTIARLPITLFYRAFSIDSYYINDEGQFVVFTNEKYLDLCIELFNSCPNNSPNAMLKDRNNIFLIEKEVQERVNFVLSKKPITKSLVNDEAFLHLCYERSIDKKWCVASWVDQSGNYNFTKSWCIDESIEGTQNFEQVASDMMSITMDYVSALKGKTYVILSRLSNIIPDDELAEWKRLSMKNNDVLLIVMTAELESSSLILSNHPGPCLVSKRKEDISKDVNYTVASTNSQSQTPANNLGNSTTFHHHLVGSARFESPDVSMFTPSYDSVLSPMDVAAPQMPVPVPVQTLHPLAEESSSPEPMSMDPILLDISDECYGLILQVSQPLSNQPRVPLKTGFLINTGEGAIKNRVLEINLLSCQAGISTTKFLRKILTQYRHLCSYATYMGMTGITRKCGNVEFDDLGDDDDDDEIYWDDKTNTANMNVNISIGGNGPTFIGDRTDRKREKHFIQQQYMQFYRMQQKQKRQKIRELGRDLLENHNEYNIVPVHMLAVRKMLDFLVNIKVE